MFELSRFVGLSGDALRCWLISAATDPVFFTGQDVDQLFAQLHCLDEEHLAWAMKIIAKGDPQRATPLIVEYLYDERLSVASAAARAVVNDLLLPISRSELLAAIRKYSAKPSNPMVDWTLQSLATTDSDERL